MLEDIHNIKVRNLAKGGICLQLRGHVCNDLSQLVGGWGGLFLGQSTTNIFTPTNHRPQGSGIWRLPLFGHTGSAKRWELFQGWNFVNVCCMRWTMGFFSWHSSNFYLYFVFLAERLQKKVEFFRNKMVAKLGFVGQADERSSEDVRVKAGTCSTPFSTAETSRIRTRGNFPGDSNQSGGRCWEAMVQRRTPGI